MLRIEKYLFYLLLCLALSIVLIPKYYITGDGPSHTYNAKVLYDYIFGNQREFYKEFYTINRSIDPNWLGHLILGFLVQIFPPWLADKFFQVSYVVLFALGFRTLTKAIHSENTFLSFLFYPFVFTLPFQAGFYNYSMGLAMLCWTLAYYIRNRNDLLLPSKQFTLCILLFITSLSHGMPALLAMFIIVLLWMSQHYQLFIPFNARKLSTQLSSLGIVFFPSLLVIFLFMLKRGASTSPHAYTIWHKLKLFFSFYTSQSTRNAEIFPAISCGLLILFFLGILFFTRRKVNLPKKMNLGFVFIIMMFVCFLLYIFSPHSIGETASIGIRLAFLPPFFLILYFATKRWSDLSKVGFISASFVLTLVFLVIRFPFVMKASRIGKEIMLAAKFIDDKKLVLNLHFDYWQQLKRGDSLFHKDGSFLHFSDYLGAEHNKHLILINNYEAELNYFPVNWRPGKTPRDSMPTLIQGTLPPCGDYHAYELQVHHKIDYILIQNWRSDAYRYACVKDLITQINSEFIKVFESPSRAVIVFKRR